MPKRLKSLSILEENKLPGQTSWKMKRHSIGHIQGYASKSSVNRGEKITFYISTQANGTKYNMEIFRLGWYNGAGARSVKTIENLEGKEQGWYTKETGRHNLPDPDDTGMLDLSWKESYTLEVPVNWVSGYYLVLLTDENGRQDYIPFIVRDDFQQHELLVIAPVTTWQAYNSWGGWSLYGHWEEGKWVKAPSYNPAVYSKFNATRVSFNRPYVQGHGAGHVFDEFPAVFWLESRGYDVAYATSVELHLKRLKWNPKGIIFIGHDEYWTEQMRQYVKALRDTGVNLAFLSANNIYWRAQHWEPHKSKKKSEPRILVLNRGVADASVKSGFVVQMWRRIGHPESELMGQQFEGQVLEPADWIVSNPNHWLFHGLDVKSGDLVEGAIKGEFDSVTQNTQEVEIIASSPVTDINHKQWMANTTVYQHKSGSLVFDAGTFGWVPCLSNPADTNGNAVNQIIQGVTGNLLNRFIEQS